MAKKRIHHNSETGYSLYTDNSISSISPYQAGYRDQVNPDFRVPGDFLTPEFRPARRSTGSPISEDFSYLYWEYDFTDTTYETGIITHYAKHIGEQAIVRIPWSGSDGTPSLSRQGPSSPTPPVPSASQVIVNAVLIRQNFHPGSSAPFNYASLGTTAAAVNTWLSGTGFPGGTMGYDGTSLGDLEPNRFNGRGDWLTSASVGGSTTTEPLLASGFGGAPLSTFRLSRYTNVQSGTTYSNITGQTSQLMFYLYYCVAPSGVRDYMLSGTYDFQNQASTGVPASRTILKASASATLDGLSGLDLYEAYRDLPSSPVAPLSVRTAVGNGVGSSGVSGGLSGPGGGFSFSGTQTLSWVNDAPITAANFGSLSTTIGTTVTGTLPTISSGGYTCYPVLAGQLANASPDPSIPAFQFQRDTISKFPEYFTTPDIFFGGTKKLYLQKRNNPPIELGTYNIYEPIHTALTPQENQMVVSVFRGGRDISLTGYDGNSTGDIEVAVHLMNFQRVVANCNYDQVTQHVIENNIVTSSTTTLTPTVPAVSVWQNLTYDLKDETQIDFDFFNGGDIATINGTTSGSGPPEENFKTIANIVDEKDYYESFFGYRYITTHERIFHVPSSDPPGYDFEFDEPAYGVVDYFMPVSEIRLQIGNLVDDIFYYVKPADTNFLGSGELGLCSEDPVLTGNTTAALNVYDPGINAFPDINTSMLAKATEENQEDRLVTMYTVQGTWDDGTDTWTETSSQTINNRYALPLLQGITVDKTATTRPNLILTAVVYDPYDDPPVAP